MKKFITCIFALCSLFVFAQEEIKVEPSVIPHSIEGYEITKDRHDCMNCHSPDISKQMGAGIIPDNHFVNVEEKELDAKRYICTSCHIQKEPAFAE